MASQYADVPALRHIATILIDARRLYERAAELAGNDPPALSRILRTLDERIALLSDIQNHTHKLGAAPQAHGSMLGAAHKAYLDMRAVFDRDLHAALAEVERGEKYLCDEIRKAMRRTDLSAETRAFLGVALDRVMTGEHVIEEMHAQLHEKPPAERRMQ